MTASAHASGNDERATGTVARVISSARRRGGLSAADIAEVVGVGQRQVQNWAAGRGKPADKQRLRRLTDLQYVVDLASEIYAPETVEVWLNSRNRTLGGRRPLDLLAADNADEVIEALEQMANGSM
jgi:transcriptional regulator with XRE-family HTH domain